MSEAALQALFEELSLTCVWPGQQVTAVDQANCLGDTPLHVVAMWGAIDSAKLLLEMGVDINTAGEDGDTPLHSAVMGDHPLMVSLLLDRGADPSIQNRYNDTPLELAIALNAIAEVIDLLS